MDRRLHSFTIFPKHCFPRFYGAVCSPHGVWWSISSSSLLCRTVRKLFNWLWRQQYIVFAKSFRLFGRSWILVDCATSTRKQHEISNIFDYALYSNEFSNLCTVCAYFWNEQCKWLYCICIKTRHSLRSVHIYAFAHMQTNKNTHSMR